MTAAKHTPADLWELVDDGYSTRVVIDGVGISAPYRLEPGSGRCAQRDADNRFIAASPHLVRVAQRSLAEVTATTEGVCGCNGTPPLCLTCDLRDVLGKVGGV